MSRVPGVRVVVVHGRPEPGLEGALRDAGVERVLEVGDASIWAVPPDPVPSVRSWNGPPKVGSTPERISVAEAAERLVDAPVATLAALRNGQLLAVAVPQVEEGALHVVSP